jgi:hypothetical protein
LQDQVCTALGCVVIAGVLEDDPTLQKL